MREVAIIGAGELGGALAFQIARRGTAHHVRLIDEGSVAAGKALDIAQSAPIERFATRVSGDTRIAAAAGATVIVVADRHAGGEWDAEAALALLGRLTEFSDRERPPLLLMAGAGCRVAIERGVRELQLDRRRLFGSAPEALASAVRAIVAVEANTSPQDVALTVLGAPPSTIVVPWEFAAIGGLAATHVLDEPSRRRIAARLPALWPPGPLALAAAAAKTIDVIAGRRRSAVSCFVVPDTATAARARTVALPAVIGPGGIERSELPDLTPRDRSDLDTAMLL